MKRCTRCKNVKSLEEFYPRKKSRDGKTSWCKSCILENGAIYQISHRKEIYEACRIRRKENKERYYEYAKLWRKENPEKVKEYYDGWKKTHHKNIKAIKLRYYKANYEKIHSANMARARANPEKSREYRRRSYAKRYSTMRGKLNSNISSSVYGSLHKNKNGRHWEDLVGFTLAELKDNIEKKFTEGMSWERYMKGEIHLDHIIPMSVFNFSTPEDVDFKRCWNLKNLQPLWANDNQKKGAKINKPFQPSLLLFNQSVVKSNHKHGKSGNPKGKKEGK